MKFKREILLDLRNVKSLNMPLLVNKTTGYCEVAKGLLNIHLTCTSVELIKN